MYLIIRFNYHNDYHYFIIIQDGSILHLRVCFSVSRLQNKLDIKLGSFSLLYQVLQSTVCLCNPRQYKTSSFSYAVLCMFVFLQHQLGMEFKPFALLYPVLQIRGCVQNCKTSFKDSYRNLHGTTARYYNVLSLFTTNARYSSYQIAPVPLPIPAGITKPYTCSLLIPET